MWEALIKLVESWSYRCKHDWEQVGRSNTFFTSTDRMPYKTTVTYRCTSCCASKQIDT
jgi:hypothetical protein